MAPPVDDPHVEDLHVTAVAVGGDGVAREPSGRVVFVAGALPGERVRAEIVAERRAHARAVVTGVLAASPDRVDPPCPYVPAGCGGCGWQHVDPEAQRRLKAAMVADALAHLGGVEDGAVAPGPGVAGEGYRTTVRAEAGDDGRLALRRHRSHDLVAVPGCLVAHPAVAEILDAGRFPPGARVTVRVGARTGERLVVVDAAGSDEGPGPGPDGAAADEAAGRAAVDVPAGTRVVTGAELAAGRRAWLHEEAAGRRWRVSARSFFQSGPDAAEALVDVVARHAGAVGATTRFADLYGGVGLFAGTVGRRSRVELVEASPSATADARVNLASLAARVVRSDVTRWRPRPMDVVVADPPRAGLGRAGVRVVAATRAPRLVLVSCDAAALGRDAGLLGGAGYELVEATVVDVFPHTPHVEVVSRFDRRRS